MATMTLGRNPVAVLASSSTRCPLSSSPSSSAAWCASSFGSQFGGRFSTSENRTAAGAASRFSFASKFCLQKVGGVELSGQRRERSRRGSGRRWGRGLLISAGSRERDSDEPTSGESGPSGSNEGENDDEDLDVQARFRLQSTDWRAFRARLVKGASRLSDSKKNEDLRRWAHALMEPEKGCLLIAHPTAFGSRQTYFNQAVIFIFEHGKDGSAGFILNRPTSFALGHVPGFEKFKPEFTEAPLYMGGDVGTNLVQVLHGVPGLQDSKEVIAGVYLGGSDAVNKSVKTGETAPNDFRWFLGYCGWRPGQLEQEVAHGVWYLASASRDVVTTHCIRLEKPLWRQVLELMGGEYIQISKRAYGET